MKGKTYYEILGVEQPATGEQIKKAWKRLAGELHPDRNPGQDAQDRFRAAREAFECLSDQQKRADYDDALCRVKREAAEREARKKQAEGRARARRQADARRPEPKRHRGASENAMFWAFGLGGVAAATYLAHRFAPRDASGRHRDRHTGQYRKGYFL